MSAADNLSPQQFLYHVAPVESRSSIAEHGLDWRKGPGAEDVLSHDDNPKGNYFHPRQESGEAMAQIWRQDLYRVKADGLTTKKDLSKSEAVYTPDPVPPSHVELLRSYENYEYKEPKK